MRTGLLWPAFPPGRLEPLSSSLGCSPTGTRVGAPRPCRGSFRLLYRCRGAPRAQSGPKGWPAKTAHGRHSCTGGHCKATGIAHVSPDSRQQLPGAGPCCRGAAWTSDAVLGSSPRRALCPSGFDASSGPACAKEPFTAHRGVRQVPKRPLPRPRQGAAACRYHWRRRRRAARGDASCLRHPCTEPSPDDPCQPAGKWLKPATTSSEGLPRPRRT